MAAIRALLVLVGTLAAIGLGIVPAKASQSAMPDTANVVCNTVVVLPAQDGSTVSLPGRSGSTDCFLANGDVSPAVGVLQSALKLCNLRANISVDDDFGPQTESAVRSFQSARGLWVDGVFGNQTRNAMNWPDNDTLHCTRPTHF